MTRATTICILFIIHIACFLLPPFVALIHGINNYPDEEVEDDMIGDSLSSFVSQHKGK